MPSITQVRSKHYKREEKLLNKLKYGNELVTMCPYETLEYARGIGCRFPEGEEVMSTTAFAASGYAIMVINKRFFMGEESILGSSIKGMYMRYFELKESDMA